MSELLNKLLENTVENEVVEFKRAKNQYDKDQLGKYFSALSNEANLLNYSNAYFVMGIDDNMEIVGTQINAKKINEYKSEISNHTSPKLSFNNVYEEIVDGKKVLIFEIPAAPLGQPVSWKGHRYGRDGESLGALRENEFERIRSQINTRDWSSQIIETASLDDLDSDAIAFAREQFIEKNPKFKNDINEWSDTVFLNKAKVTIKGKITNTAILLLGKLESEHYLSPSVARITWLLKDKDNLEKDYEHFYNPFILAVDEVSSKIRNLKYRYMLGSLFPEEVDQYELYTIREALNNCIAHQDYSLNGKIFVIENEDGWLSFTNSGTFIPKSVEDVVISQSPEPRYRNTFLADAMVNLNMIDTVGSGIKRMFNIQRSKFFPLPEYNFDNNKVSVKIYGKVTDVNYTTKLASMPDLTIESIMLLDKVAKKKPLLDEEASQLRKLKLIEGRKPNYHISSTVAYATGKKVDYMKQRGIDDEYCQKMILDYIKKFGKGTRKDFEDLLLNKLPDVLNIEQKKNKVKNNLQSLRKAGKIIIHNRVWVLK